MANWKLILNVQARARWRTLISDWIICIGHLENNEQAGASIGGGVRVFASQSIDSMSAGNQLCALFDFDFDFDMDTTAATVATSGELGPAL